MVSSVLLNANSGKKDKFIKEKKTPNDTKKRKKIDT